MNGYVMTAVIILCGVVAAVLFWAAVRDVKQIRVNDKKTKKTITGVMDECSRSLINGNHAARQNTIAELSALKDDLERARSGTGEKA